VAAGGAGNARIKRAASIGDAPRVPFLILKRVWRLMPVRLANVVGDSEELSSSALQRAARRLTRELVPRCDSDSQRT